MPGTAAVDDGGADAGKGTNAGAVRSGEGNVGVVVAWDEACDRVRD